MRINAHARIVQAKENWFESLTDEQKTEYLKEHPDSKYAKNHKKSEKKDDGELRTGQPKSNEPVGKTVVDPEQQGTGKGIKYESTLAYSKSGKKGISKFGFWKDDKTWVSMTREEAESKMSDEEIENIQRGKPSKPGKGKPKVSPKDAKKGSPARKKAGSKLKKSAPGLAGRLLQDSGSLLKGVASVADILRGKGSSSDFGSVGKLGFTLLSSSIIASTFALSGPVGFAAFMALKHLALPAMGNIVKSAFNALTDDEKDDPKALTTNIITKFGDYTEDGDLDFDFDDDEDDED